MQYAGWYLVAVNVLVWVVGVVVMLEKRRRYYSEHSYVQDTSTSDFISFTDKQQILLIVLWPISTLVFLMFIATCWLIRFYDGVGRWFSKK